jgi:hypothetical protein
MYEIEYYVEVDEGSPMYYRVDSNHLPRSDEDVTLDGINYKVISVNHILNTNKNVYAGATVDEKFIVTVQKRK